ncbi:hypothetical protein HY745_11765 [Candidatus Desantisbacteria bacterium]|nr:hypothetical protein [Candidatus Desantisbacteria bacterium]
MPEQINEIKKDFGLIEVLEILFKYRRFIILSTLSVCIFMAVYSLLLNNRYQATATILPPSKENSNFGNLLSQLPQNAISLAGGSLGIKKDPSELYISMLKSRRINDQIIENFKLKEIYKFKDMKDVRKYLESNAFFDLGKKDGIISISVIDESPKRAADMVNEYIKLLKELNDKIIISSARREREFLEKRIVMIKDIELKKTQEEFRIFQEKNKTINISAQSDAVIEAAATIQATIFSLEAELKGMEVSISSDSMGIKVLKEKIKELKKQLKSIEGKSNEMFKKDSDSIYPVINNLPSLAIGYANLLRNMKIQETVLELITKQYELAKIQEAKESFNIEILDYAQIPAENEKVGPKRRIMVMTYGVITLFFTILLSFLIELLKKIKVENKIDFKKYLKL